MSKRVVKMSKHLIQESRRVFDVKHLPYMLLFPIVFCYYELIFKASTSRGFFSIGTLFTVLFSFAYGILFYLVTSISKNKKANHIIATVLLAVTAVIFLVEYFVYREFKIFYDISTVTNGANDVFGDYIGEIANLIFCFNGISKIILFALPTVIFAWAGKAFVPAYTSDKFKRIIAGALAVVIFITNVIGINLSPIKAKYRYEYTFQDAVSNFGLFTALRLDVKKLIFGGADEDFDITDSEPQESEEEKEPEVIEYGYNSLDIDFNSLKSTASGKFKSMDEYVSSLSASKKNEYTGLFKGKNLIMITAEALSAEVIDKDLTPTLYRLATKGINFTDYYQPASAGTTGGEFENLLGLMPSHGGMSFSKIISHNLSFTMGHQLNKLGYYGKAFHNNTYTYYDRHKTHIHLGYSDGYMGYGNGMEAYVTNQWPQSDCEMLAGTLPTYIDKQPFNVYYMSVSGHGGYSLTGNSMSFNNKDAVKDLPYSDPVKYYLAANIELDKGLEAVIKMLEEKGIANDTVIVIGADHFPYSLDKDAALGHMPYLSELYGYDVVTNIQRDHNRLIIWSGCLEDKEPIVVSSPTFSLDILPTLSNLFGLDFDSRLFVGRDVLSDAEAIIFNTGYDWKTDLGTYISAKATFTPNEGVTVQDGYVDRIKAIVRNKLKFSSDLVDYDYYAHVFGNK